MYTVVKEFMSAHSPVSYYRQGRVLDLAALSDPVAGAVAMGEMVAMYAQNGSISKTLVATKLQRDFAAVAKQLREDRTIAALARLYGIKVYIRAQLKLGTIDPEAGRILLYARLKLVQSVMTGSGFALKGTEEDQFGGSIPGEFALSQNYPNPFNPTTTIGFTLPTAAHVSLDVYNMLGQRVRSLIDAEMEAGAHQVDWNSTDQNGHPVSSGVYFYRLVAGANVASRKMVLLK